MKRRVSQSVSVERTGDTLDKIKHIYDREVLHVLLPDDVIFDRLSQRGWHEMEEGFIVIVVLCDMYYTVLEQTSDT